MLLPNFKQLSFNSENIFGKFTLQESQLNELNKKVYNYLEYESLGSLSERDKTLLITYYDMLLNIYFNVPRETELNPDVNNILFNYNQWNIMRNRVLYFQDYIKNLFAIKYNTFVSEYFNKIFAEVTEMYNKQIIIINNIYTTNFKEDGTYAFAPITNNHLSEDLKKIYNIITTNIDNNIYYVKTTKNKPEQLINQHLILYTN